MYNSNHMKYKTYKKRPTKYQKSRKANQTALALVFALTFSLSTYSAITASKTLNTLTEAIIAPHSERQSITIDQLTLLPAKSDSEREVWLASFRACEKHNVPDINACADDLHAIAATETGNSFNLLSIGDGGKSKGAFQIHQGYHPNIKTGQANDPYFAADWTLARMINNGYLTNRDRAIMKHNGTPNTPKTLKYLSKVNSYLININ